MTDEVMDYLLGGSVPSAAFLTVGTVHRGKVKAAKVQQQRDFVSGNPKTFDNGDPMLQVVLTIQTDERDPENEDDDGLRNVYVKGQMLEALRNAVKRAKHKGSLVGGDLAVKYDSDGEPPRAGFNAPKQYRVIYEAPDPLDVATEPEYDGAGFDEEPF